MNYTYYRRYQKPSRRRKRSQFSSFLCLLVFLVLIALILKLVLSIFTSISEEKRDDILISVEKGTGEILPFGQSEWEAAPDLGILLEGDSIQSGEGGYLLLSLYDGSNIRMNENSYLSFDKVENFEDGSSIIYLTLNDGQIWYENEKDSLTQVVIHTDNMDVVGGRRFLLSNKSDNESIYVFEGNVNVDYVDRGINDLILESATLSSNYKSIVNDEVEQALINREAVTLVTAMQEDELAANEFLMWSLGENRFVDSESDTKDNVDITNDITDQAPDEAAVVQERLLIEVTSPVSGYKTADSAIAIEGVIASGSASNVYVQWSGNDESYPLGLFQPGDINFRYVADINYSNFSSGKNVYTIIAYDEEGNPSNSVSVEIFGDF